jgi:prevent-host-death family protein
VAITTFSSREFNQDVSRAKRAAKKGPVFVTDRGRPSHVLLSIEQYRAITKRPKSLAEAVAMPNAGLVDFDPPRLGSNEFPVPADFS